MPTDTERLDWLAANYDRIGGGNDKNDFVVADEDGMVSIYERGIPLREAIDAAMTLYRTTDFSSRVIQ